MHWNVYLMHSCHWPKSVVLVKASFIFKCTFVNEYKMFSQKIVAGYLPKPTIATPSNVHQHIAQFWRRLLKPVEVEQSVLTVK